MKLASPKEYAELLKASGTGLGKALQLLDPKQFAPILQMRDLTLRFITQAVERREVLPLLSEFPEKRDALLNQLQSIAEALRDLVLLKKSEAITTAFFTDLDLAIELCDRVSLQFLCRLMEAIQTAIDACTRNANVRLLLWRLLTDANLI